MRKGYPILCFAVLAAAVTTVAPTAASPCEAALREGFANPPPDVKIGCYYYWVNERAKEINAALGAARLGGKHRIYAESFTAGSWTKFAKDDWSFESLKPYADKFFRKGVNATILHVVISQPGDDAEPPMRPLFGTFFDRRSKNVAEMKKLVPYLRRCNFMLQQGRAADGRTDTRILPDGTRIRFTEQSLFEVVFPDGRTETWNPVSSR